MVRFIHGYDERYLPGLERNGFLGKNSGLKITQHFATPENEKFNRLAAKGGTLHRLVKENRHLFYIDRLQGGTFYSHYDFDRALLQEYQDLLGEWFLGIQMHEWGSAINGDWNRIRTQLADVPAPWTERQIHDAIAKVSACKWCLHLSCGTAEEYSRKNYAATLAEYLEEMRQLFIRRQTETNTLLLPCDSYAMATAMEYNLGARTVMPEVGAQIPLMRLQVAIARGLSTARHSIWGTYYEPWGGSPFSAPHFFEEPLNEWRLHNANFPYDFTSNGPNGGSSRTLQRRIYYYSLMSGAHYLGEEWGVSNTFANWRDYPLTPYGEIKKDFIDFAERTPTGSPFVPFAIVLPQELEVVDLAYIDNPEADTYLGRTPPPRSRAIFDHAKKVLRMVYARHGKIFGNEGHTITNSRFGDVFDIIHENAGEQAFAQYTHLIDASPDSRFARTESGRAHRVLESRDVDLLAHSLAAILEADLPCAISGGAHWLLNRMEDKWLLAIFNNEGIDRTAEKGDVSLREADLMTTIRFKHEPKELLIMKCWPPAGTLSRHADGSYHTIVQAGGFLILSFALT